MNTPVTPLPAAPSMDQLRGLHLPEAVSAWPPAPGWWIVTLIIITGTVWCVYYLHRLRNQRSYRRIARQELEHAWQHYQASPQSETEKRQYVTRVNRLLKRVALVTFNRNTVASLQGEQWLHFLDTSMGLRVNTPAAEQKSFTATIGSELSQALYSANNRLAIELTDLQTLAQIWIKKHSQKHLTESVSGEAARA